MDIARMDEAPIGLSRRWRRGLVVATMGAVGGIVLLHLAASTPPRLLYLGEVVLAAVAIVCIWLLADALRPWLDGDAASAEERAHADEAVRRAYGLLSWVVLGTVIYLQLGQAGVGPAWGAERERVLLWFVLAMVALLPGSIAAWEDVSDDRRKRTLGPVALTLSRLRGPWGATYATGLLALLFAPVLLLMLATSDGPLLDIGSVAVLVILAILAPLSLRAGSSMQRRTGSRNA